MNVFVAGASGAIGRPLVAELVRRGHAVTGMTRSDAGATALADLGAAVVRSGAYDAEGLERALRASRAEVVIDELTALPKSPADMAAAAAGDRRLRLEGGGNLLSAALRCGARRYVQQASGFFLRPGPGSITTCDGTSRRDFLQINSLAALGLNPALRHHKDGSVYLTDENNFILDCAAGEIADPQETAAKIRSIVGVVEHGLFLNMASLALIASDGGVVEVVR